MQIEATSEDFDIPPISSIGPERHWPISGIAQLCLYYDAGSKTHFQGHLIQAAPRRCFGVMANGNYIYDPFVLSLHEQ